MTGRGILDEAFIGQAFENVDKREIAYQNLFNGYEYDAVPCHQKSIFVTAVTLYKIKNILSDEHVEKAQNVQTYGELRDLVDELNSIRLEYFRNHRNMKPH